MIIIQTVIFSAMRAKVDFFESRNIEESSKRVQYRAKRHRTNCHVGQVGTGQVDMQGKLE